VHSAFVVAVVEENAICEGLVIEYSWIVSIPIVLGDRMVKIPLFFSSHAT
jgi:hypothetical protein